MAVSLRDGHRTWKVTRNAEGHRTYTIKHLVQCDSTDGPANALSCPGLPLPGSVWIFDNDVDLWAFCTQEAEVTPVVSNEPNEWFEVDQKFSTRPNRRCSEAQFDDPLLEPYKISINTVKYTEEATEDRNGNPIKNSSHEQIRGAQVEVTKSKFTVRFSKNYSTLGSEVWGTMLDTLNDAELWGFPARCIKLSTVTVAEQYYGQCFKYYAIEFEFEVFVRIDPVTGDTVSGFDRDLLDEGTKVLNGRWGRGGDEGHGWILQNINGTRVPDPTNPADFMRFKDRNGENTRVILNGAGIPYDADGLTSGTADDEPGYIHVEFDGESNFLLLGVPPLIGV